MINVEEWHTPRVEPGDARRLAGWLAPLFILQACNFNLDMAEDVGMSGEERWSFEALSAGQMFASAARTLTETHLVMFTMLTGDWSPIHSDEVFAAATPIGKRMFHGTFGVALAIAMSAEALRLREPVLAALGISDWTFKAPLFIGDTVHAKVGIKAKRVTSDGKRGIIEREVQLVKSDETIAQQGFAGLMVRLPPS